jgi:glucosamine--fructose-6-phosphate aminotransferase (isomerizing)
LQRLIAEERGNVANICRALRGQFDYVMIAARGTSDNAARYALYLLGAHNQLPVALATPSLFTTYRQPPSLQGALIVGISQSGRSPDIVSVIEEGKRQGRPTLVLTNIPDSPLAQAADHVIPLCAGPERAVAATKTYTASLAALALFSATLANDQNAIAQLEQMPSRVQQALAGLSAFLPRVERYRYMDHIAVLGRGFNYATAFEISLKIKELTRTVAEPYSSADFLHGPIAMIQRGFPTFIVAPNGAVQDDLRALIHRLQELGAELLIASDTGELLAQAHLPMPLPVGIPEWLSPIVAVLPGQLFAFALARARGLSADQPEGLNKVTETW